MPCEECGHLLCFEEPEEGEDIVPATLYCPRCEGLTLEYESRVNLKTNWVLEEHLSDYRVIGAITQFRKRDLVFYLTWRLNKETSRLFESAEMKFSEIKTVTYILKQVYGRTDFGEETVGDIENPPDEIEDIIEGYSIVLRCIRDVENDFLACVGQPERHLDWKGNRFVEEYDFRPTEYNLCFERCIRSIIGGRKKNRVDFEFVADNLRLADKTPPENIETLKDFGDCWYQLIVSLKFIASADELANDVYYTDMPASLDVFQIEEFIDELNRLTSDRDQAIVREESALFELHPEWVEKCGKTVFGSDWAEIKQYLIFSESTLDAHPFLFYIEYSALQDTSGLGSPMEVPKAGVIYQPDFAEIMKLQMYPLFKNGSNKSGHTLLSDLTAGRGANFERKLYDYLQEKGHECYYEPIITKNNENEIDLILIHEGKIWYIEVKFFMPTKAILTSGGIEEINEKFDFKIFNIDTDQRNSSPSGKPFPRKVKAWTELDPGSTFSSLMYKEGRERKEQRVKEKWKSLETEILVVSNLVPSYVEKEGVQFLTDLEFYKLIENDERVFSDIREPAP